MPTVDQLLKAKSKRLETVPGKFVSQIEKVQSQLIRDVEVILALFDLDDDGNFLITEANMLRAVDMDVLLRQALDRSEYNEVVTEFAKEFNVQIGINDTYFSQAFKGFETSELGRLAVQSAQKNAVTLLINQSPDIEFVSAIQVQVEQAVVNGARFRETLDIIQQITTGNDQTDGKILAYSKQISHDTFAVADRSYSAAVAEQVGASWFKYSGGEIKSTRPFCAERFNQFFCKKEIEMWGDGIKTVGMQWPKGGEWAGEMEGTNGKTIFSTLGGYNCLHNAVAVSIISVPIEDIQRAMSAGYYEPTDFEKEELGL